uniref:Uncharacterized protein n=1 Tax=Solanum lycopersicum TaxID=4081 RepID=K4CBI0_SOLLC
MAQVLGCDISPFCLCNAQLQFYAKKYTRSLGELHFAKIYQLLAKVGD